MSPIEDRIAAATRAAADTVPDGSAPPLNVLARPRKPLAGRQRPARTRRLLAPLAAATAVIAVVAVSAAVVSGGSLSAGSLSGGSLSGGSAKKVSTEHRPRAESSAANSAAADHLAKRDAGAIDQFMPASGAQYTTGALFYGEIQALESDTTATCMAQRGFRIGRTTATEAAQGDFDLTQFPDLGMIARTGTLPQGVAASGSNWSAAFKASLQPCMNAARTPFQPLLEAGSRLAAPFLKAEVFAPAPAAVLATLPGLRSCAARYGWPGQPYGAPDSTINSFGDFVGWVAGHIDGAGSRGASPAELSGLDRHWARAFVTCARPTITVQYRLWMAEQKMFLRAHRRQVQAFFALVNKIMTDAGRRASGATTG